MSVDAHTHSSQGSLLRVKVLLVMGEEVVKYERISVVVAVMVNVVVVVAIIFADTRDHKQEEKKKKSYSSALKKGAKEIDVNSDLWRAENSYMAHNTLLCLSMFPFRWFVRSFFSSLLSLSLSLLSAQHTQTIGMKRRNRVRETSTTMGTTKMCYLKFKKRAAKRVNRVVTSEWVVGLMQSMIWLQGIVSGATAAEKAENKWRNFVCNSRILLSVRETRVLLFSFLCSSSDFLPSSSSRRKNMHINLKAIVSNERIIFDWLA